MAKDNVCSGNSFLDVFRPHRAAYPRSKCPLTWCKRHSACHRQGLGTGKEQSIKILFSQQTHQSEVEKFVKPSGAVCG